MLFGTGVRRLIDAQQQFTRAAHPVYLRTRDFPDVQQLDAQQLGFVVAPTGTSQVGTTDTLITPPPSVTMVSIHDIGQSMGKLRFGARRFLISANWVTSIANTLGYSDETLVFRGENVVGLVLDSQLFSIEDYWHEEVAGLTVNWGCVGNSNELR